MKKIYFLLALSILVSCYDDYIEDYDYNAVYFTQQTNVRTFVVGEGMQIKVGVALGGVRENTFNREVDFVLDNNLLTDEILTTMKGGVSHIKDYVSSVSELLPLPADYFTLSDNSKMIIKAGDHKGVITVKADSVKFLADTKTLVANYALPFYITDADTDSILSSKRYSVIGLRYENMLFGNYWHGGETVVKDASGNVVETIKYYTAIPSPESKVMKLQTVAPHSLITNRISDSAGSFKITLDGDNILISKADDSNIEVLPDGESKFNRAKLLQDRKLYLKYKYDNGDGTTSYATDTLTFRNRIRDGVNEWQDENPANYE
ncbi:DUF1735 domain-containing protein [Parabacteroides sp. Marseille-P3160]|uniref:DUF1735 domain-containing protein n=1 Tax=Parabacteroides sp. Marseille-P3160 TaxID=1917887 RepID=UPI0009BBC0B7|nr:DUF1735 domain-containing protein [Parabacteroides sp. Marseille-P3160]